MMLWNACYYNTYLVDFNCSTNPYTKQLHAGITLTMIDITDADTDIEAIRLINGDDDIHLGRLELLYNGTWGTVCDRRWSSLDAKVACRSVYMPLYMLPKF